MLVMLRNKRIDVGMTQAELAQKMGVSRLFIGRCERGDRRLDVIELLAFCSALGIEPQKFIAELQKRRQLR